MTKDGLLTIPRAHKFAVDLNSPSATISSAKLDALMTQLRAGLREEDEAEALAKDWLANRELTESEKGIVEIALRDAGDNRAKLRAKIKRQKGDG